jgi:two-component system nitrogen regulation sensor histidine kinase NtrY
MNKKSFKAYILPLILLSFSILLPSFYALFFTGTNNPQNIQKKFDKLAQSQHNQIKQVFLRTDSLASENLFKELLDIKQKSNLNIDFFVYEKDSLIAWTTNNYIITPNDTKGGIFEIKKNKNLFRVETIKNNNRIIISSIILKYSYPISNQYLNSRFNDFLGLKNSFKISDDGITIKEVNGGTAFKIKPIEKHLPENIVNIALIGVFLSFFWILLLITKKHALIPLIISLAFSIFFTILGTIKGLSLFEPYIYSSGSLFKNIGTTFWWAVAFYFFSLWFSLKIKKIKTIILKNYILPITLYPIIFISIFYFFRTIVLDSTIDFKFYDITSYTLYKIFTIIIIGITIIATIKISDAIFPNFSEKYKYASLIFSLVIIFPLLIILFKHTEDSTFAVLLYIIVLATLYFIKTSEIKIKNIIGILGISLVVTLLSLYFSNQKEDSIKELLITKLSEEKDPVVEALSQEIITEIKKDTLVTSMLNDSINLTDLNEKLNTILKKKYFTGYWNNYDIQATTCTPECELQIIDNNKIENCFSYFFKLLDKYGSQTETKGLYFLNNNNGRISYLIVIKQKPGWRIFIEIDSKLVSVKQGYPELILDYKVNKNNHFQEYCYAKYKNGKLYSQYGNFAYPLTDEIFSRTNNLSYITFNGYDHLIYLPDKNSVFILSSPHKGIWIFLQQFSYIFVIAMLFWLIIAVYNNNLPRIKNSFRNQILFSLFSILFIFFLVVASIVILITKNNFNKSHRKNLEEKLESVVTELSKVNLYDTGNNEQLTNLLHNLSEVFYTDIHIYNKSGYLISTSIPIIFEKNIQAPLINPTAYYYLHNLKFSRYLKNEKIGKLNFLSIYSPLLDKNYEPVMYINLPYFTKQTEINKQLVSAITSVINIFIFLSIIAFLLALILAEKITVPLTLIRKHLQEIRLDNKNKKITINKSDEIGELVKEYNLMIDKLEESAKLLAQSERESAWREMARQVAHDIKNPLTPMKLSIQYLQQSWKNYSGKDLEDFINKIASTIIEQIDTITFITNEFSNFAKTPQVKKEKVEVKPHLDKIVSLYEKEGNINIIKNYTTENAVICFDHHYFNRVMSNIIKNAVQSIPRSREGIIEITVKELNNKTILIAVKDNGIGISEDIKNKIFYPNFTTKASGTGLGLAISKNLIESVGGKIYFETSEKGTTFFIEFEKCG